MKRLLWLLFIFSGCLFGEVEEEEWEVLDDVEFDCDVVEMAAEISSKGQKDFFETTNEFQIPLKVNPISGMYQEDAIDLVVDHIHLSYAYELLDVLALHSLLLVGACVLLYHVKFPLGCSKIRRDVIILHERIPFLLKIFLVNYLREYAHFFYLPKHNFRLYLKLSI